MDKKKKLIITVILLAVALVSIFVLGRIFSNIDTYKGIVDILDSKKNNVTGLAAATSAVSIGISFIPGDAGTPFANQLGNISSYLVIILAIIYLEKYLLTTVGYIVFYFVVPAVCVIFGFAVWFSKDSLIKLGKRILLFCAAMMLLVPTSVTITKLIDDTYQTSLITRIEEDEQSAVEQIEDEVKQTDTTKDKSTTTNEEKAWYEIIVDNVTGAVGSAWNTVKDTAVNAYNSVTKSVSSAIDYVKKQINKFIEATAVMLVTSCLIPILTFIVFKWLVKVIMDVDIKSSKLLEQKDKIKDFMVKDRTTNTKQIENNQTNES